MLYLNTFRALKVILDQAEGWDLAAQGQVEQSGELTQIKFQIRKSHFLVNVSYFLCLVHLAGLLQVPQQTKSSLNVPLVVKGNS